MFSLLGPGGKHTQLKGLILAQNERWRRGLGMQVVRQRASHHALRKEILSEVVVRGAGERRKGE